MNESQPASAGMAAPGPWRFETPGGGGIGVLAIDAPGQKVNVLSYEMLDELASQLERIPHLGLSGLVITSGKPRTFVTGADVREIQAIRTAEEGALKAARGQAIFQRLAMLATPTLAAIDGLCLGGGTELALACRYRVASDFERTFIGLPEVRLGILPGYGGSTRLPRLIGLPAALDLILTGKTVDAMRAYKLGLVDDVLPREDFVTRAVDWLSARLDAAALRRVRAERRGRRTGPPAWMLEGNPLGRALVFSQARKGVMRETHGHYPAPLKVLDILPQTGRGPIPEALALEARAVGELLVTPEHKNLLSIFFLTEGAKKDPPTPHAVDVQSVGVLGAGVMGGGIAFALSDVGIPARLKDVAPEAVGKGLKAAYDLYQRRVRRRRLKPAVRDRKMRLIAGGTDYAGFSRLDAVIEAIVEKLEIKQTVLAEVEAHLPAHAILLTNTSSLDVDTMASRMASPERLAGLHFFNPVDRMPLVEIIVGARTSKAATETALALARRLGKTPVVVKNAPGFLVNRILMPYLNEGLHLFRQGVHIETLDDAMVDFGMPMGPLRLLDEIGLDVADKVSHVLGAAFGDRVDPAGVLDAMVAGGRIGKKGGLGFYRYRDGVGTSDPAVYPLADRPSRDVITAGPGAWRERMILAMINEAARCLEESIVESPAQVDLAMIMGTGFPPFRGGLLRHADMLGLPVVADRLRALAQVHGARFEPCALIGRMALDGYRFRPEFD
ncbi:MAG: 3-hydroxyacyl-CoA dehydrogenase NAD-binding domain-containing protein [Candidatus Eisenbacteria bacterium]